MKRRPRIVCALMLALACLGVAPAAQSAPKLVSPSWAHSLWSKATSGLTAAAEYRDGTYIYTDHVFDDLGAAAERTYPSSGAPYMRNGADIAEVRVRPEGHYVVFGVRLNTLLDINAPIVAVGVTHGSMGKRAVGWPFGAGIRAAGVGQVITLKGTKAIVTDLASPKSSTYALHVRNNTPKGERHLENTLTVKLPMSALRRSELPSQLRVFAAAGVRDGDRWLAPSDNGPAPFDIAFVAGEAFGNWQSTKQGTVIAGGDITKAVGIVDRSKFPNTRPPTPKGAHIRIYRPSIEMKTGEGVEAQMNPVIGPLEDDIKAAAGDRWNGLFLPFAVWVPKGYDGTKPMPLFLHLHGLSQTHQDMIPAWISGDIDVPAIAVTPLGRGTQSYYHGQGALDVFESLREAKRRYNVDDDRVFITGLSMGGQGTYTLGTQRPDLFAAALPIVGPGSGKDFLWPVPADAVIGGDREIVQLWRNGSFGRELLENAMNLPFRIYAAAVDPLSTVAFTEGDNARWEELGYDYQAALFLQRSHSMLPEYQNALFHRVLDGCKRSDVADGCERSLDPRGIVRDPNPARVVYKSVPFMFYPDLGLEFDGAYWVSDMKLRTREDSLSYSRIDVTSYGLAHKLRGEKAKVDPELRTYEPTGDPYKFQARLWGAKPKKHANGLDMTVENLAAATFDLRRARIDTTKRITIVATGDGPSKLTLLGPVKRGTRFAVTRDGKRVGTIEASSGRFVLSVDLDGKHTYVLTPLS